MKESQKGVLFGVIIASFVAVVIGVLRLDDAPWYAMIAAGAMAGLVCGLIIRATRKVFKF